MKYLINIGCFIIGWNKHILRECGEASYRQFRKLLSAICIMMILWGTIGYCFADRYINIESVPINGRQSPCDECDASADGIMYGNIRLLYL